MNDKKKQIKGLLSELLPQPISSGKQMIAGDPPEVIAMLTDKGLAIAPYHAEWITTYTLKVVASDANLVEWNDLPGETEQLQYFLSQAIDAARKNRKATYKKCSLCNQSKPQEQMNNKNTCQNCASEKLGVVY